MQSIFLKPQFCFASGDDSLRELEQTKTNVAPTALGEGVPVDSVHDLLKKIAQLNSANPKFRLMFRGQKEDHKIQLTYNDMATFLYPSALREACLTNENIVILGGETRDAKDFAYILETLNKSFYSKLRNDHPLRTNKSYVTKYETQGVVQHYEVAPTPFLDVTSDWRVACSFSNYEGNGSYLYVLGVPDFDEPISVKVESDLVIIDLARVCPPTALRPHFQSGFLLSPFQQPSMNRIIEPYNKYPPQHWDFTNRLLAKFQLTDDFWKSEGAPNDPLHLYFPDEEDPIFEISNQVRGMLGIPVQRTFRERNV